MSNSIENNEEDTATQIIVVKAIPTLSNLEKCYRWIKILILVNIIQYAYIIFNTDEIIVNGFSGLMIGLYLPLCGYKGLESKNRFYMK